MAKVIQAWAKFGPKLEPVAPMKQDELIEYIVAATNQSRGSVLAVLSELDMAIKAALKIGRIVTCPIIPIIGLSANETVPLILTSASTPS